MFPSEIVSVIAFAVVSLLAVWVASVFMRRDRLASQRLREVAGETRTGSAAPPSLMNTAASCLPSLGAMLAPRAEKDRARWNERLARAGVHHPQALPIMHGVKGALMLLGPVAGLVGYAADLPLALDVIAACVVSGVGMLLPGLWLERRIARRQTQLRRGLPDALDMMVMCVEGGLSLNAALPRVRAELQSAHPLLAAELRVAERDMMMGQQAGEALRKVAERIDLEELRSLAAVLIQSQRYGASTAKAMRTFADGLRIERQHRIEEKAQKAAVKILFPTLLCIFPAIFVVVLGPAAYQIRAIFTHMQK